MHNQQRVYVVDRDPSVVDELKRLLTAVGYQVTSVESAQAFLTGARVDAISCALVDLGLPDKGGFEILELLQQGKLEIPIIFTTIDGDIATCVRAMKAGGVDYLLKPLRHDALLDAIARAQAISINWYAARNEDAHARELLARLTIRERQVLALAVCGRRNKEIATALLSQEATVKVHRSRLMRKLEARSLVELVRFSRYLVPPTPAKPGPRRSTSEEIALRGPARTGVSGASGGNPYLAHNCAPEPHAHYVPGNPWADAAGSWSDFSWTTSADAETAS